SKEAWENRNRQKQYTPERNAPMVLYLLDDASAHLNGQIMRLEGRSLMLLTRPVARAPMLTDDWTVEKIEQAFQGPLKQAMAPLGRTEAVARLGRQEAEVTCRGTLAGGKMSNKTVSFARRNPALGERFRPRWRRHAALAMSLPPVWDMVVRYAQCDPVGDPPR